MAALTKAQLKAKFNTRLRDTSNITWSDTEKDDLLSAAILDQYVGTDVQDITLTTVDSQSTYVSPVAEIYDMYLDKNDDGYPRPIPRNAYDLINGNIVFTRAYKGLPAGHKLYINGFQKLTDSDSFPDLMQEYILNLAMCEAFRMLSTSLTSRFVKNDITQAEIMQKINQHAAEAARLRSQLINQRLVTL